MMLLFISSFFSQLLLFYYYYYYCFQIRKSIDNYLESEKFFSKFSRYFLERENFQNLKVRIPENFSLNFRFFESEKIFKI